MPADAVSVQATLVDAISALGVDYVFAVSGANIEGFLDEAAAHAGMEVVLAKHEFSAATMTDGFARACARPAVVATTSGAGAVNVVAGLAEMRTSGVPVLAVIGQSPAEADGKGAFQEMSGLCGSIDAQEFFAHLGVWSRRLLPDDDICALVVQAWAAATGATGTRPGPAIFLAPRDVLSSPARGSRSGRRKPAVPCAARVAPREAVHEAVRLVSRAQGRVVLWAGLEVAVTDGRAAVARLAERLDADVVVAPDARDAFDNHSHRFRGVTGPVGHPQAVQAVADAAVVCAIGNPLGQFQVGGLAEHLTTIPLVAFGSQSPSVTGALHVGGHLGATLAAFDDALQRHSAVDLRGSPPPSERSNVSVPSLDDELTAQNVTRLLDAWVPHTAVVVADAGNVGATAQHYVRCAPAGRFVTAHGMGAMGHGFGAAVGAALATRAPTVLVAGDGAFFMHGSEIHTAVEHALPILFILLNNDSHGMCVTREGIIVGRRHTFNSYRHSQLAEGAAAMFPGLTASHPSDLREFERALSQWPSKAPHVICVDVPPDEMPPFASWRTPDSPAKPDKERRA